MLRLLFTVSAALLSAAAPRSLLDHEENARAGRSAGSHAASRPVTVLWRGIYGIGDVLDGAGLLGLFPRCLGLLAPSVDTSHVYQDSNLLIIVKPNLLLGTAKD